MKYFEVPEDGLIIPKHSHWYIFRADGLKNTNIESTPTLLHLISKIWFTQDMFFDLLDYAKERYPNVDFSRIILEAGKRFYENELLEENSSQYLRITRLKDLYQNQNDSLTTLDHKENE